MKIITAILNGLSKLKCKFKSSCCTSECTNNMPQMESSSDWVASDWSESESSSDGSKT